MVASYHPHRDRHQQFVKFARAALMAAEAASAST